jgi:hypothetical protein
MPNVKYLYSPQAEKDIILKTHNDQRRKVAMGQESQGAGGGQPNAANIFELKWNDELARIAQKWADQCNFSHDTPVRGLLEGLFNTR